MAHNQKSELFSRLWHGADYNYEQWLHRPEILDEDFRLMQRARCSAMSVGIFSWAMLEPGEGRYEFGWLDGLMDRLESAGIRAILATPSAAHPAWLSRAHPEVLRVNRDGRREQHRARQVFCRTSPVFRRKIAALNTRLAERYRDHPALLLWHVSNEYGSSPCYCSTCLADFRTWLQRRYTSLENVNRAWWTSFWSHSYTDWDEIYPDDSSNNGLMLDWMRYNSDQVLDFYRFESEPLQRLAPDIPITTNFMRPDVGLNYWKIARHVDIISWDSYPEWHVGDDVRTAAETAFYHDLHRGYRSGEPFYLLETSPAQTNWQPISRLKRPGMVQLASAQAVAHGAMGVNYFQWRQSRGGEEKFHGAVMQNRAGETSQTFRSVRDVGEMLAGLPELGRAKTDARVGLVYDFENEWVLNLAHMPRSARGEYQAVVIDYYQAFWQRSIPVDILSSGGDFEKYALVVAPMLHMLSEATAQRLAHFVETGGVLLTTYLAGWVGETDLSHFGGYPAPLGDVLGIRVDEYDTFAEGQSVSLLSAAGNSLGLQGDASAGRYAEMIVPLSAEVLATYGGEFYAGGAAITANRYGNGRAYHVGVHISGPYQDHLIGRIAEQHSLHPDLPGPVQPGVVGRIRRSPAADYLFVMNFSAQTAEVPTLPAGWAAVRLPGVSGPAQLPPFGVSLWRRT